MKPDLFERRPLLLLVALVLLFFWKLVFSSQFTFLDSPDLAFQVLPWYQVQAQAWNAGEFPLWDPYQWTGQSLLGQMQPGAAFPLNWPLFLAPLDAGYIDLDWVHLHFVFMHLLAALFMYALARDLGRSRYASMLVGVAFACSGYAGSTGWPQMIHGAIWIPLVFLLFQRVLRAETSRARLAYAVLCGGTAGLSLLSGHHQTPLYTLLALSGFFLVTFASRWTESKSSAFRLAALYAVIACAAFLVAALQLVPAFEYGAEAYRWVGAPEPVTMGEDVPFYAHTTLRLVAISLLGLFVPHAYLTVSTFVGFLCLAMFAFAIATCWREAAVRGYVALAVAALAYTVGPFSLLHGWVYTFIPLADKARYPSHAIFVFQFALLVVAAFGIDRLFAVQEGEDPWIRRIAATLTAFAAAAWLLLLNQHLSGTLTDNPGDRVMLASLIALALAGLLTALRRRAIAPAGLRALLVVLMVFEMGVAHAIVLMHRTDPNRPGFLDKLAELRGVTDFLKQQPGPFRFEIQTDGDKANLGSWESLEMVDGFLASVNRGMFDFVSKDWAPRRLMLNLLYTVSKQKTRETQTEIYHDPSGWKVFRNADAGGRAWRLEDPSLLDNPADPAVAPPPVKPCESQAELLSYALQRESVQARVSAPCDGGYVVFADPYFPGWEVEVDGRPAQLYRAYGALRAVNLAAGEHDVRFVYRPSAVYWGAWLSGFGFLFCFAAAGYLWLERRWMR
ncbi:MAG TPA: YfhO family protein [Bryobacterales bacterium]|nr:YfhO family protein [Bryobacterales bacterium]